MTDYRVEAAPTGDADIEAAFAWHESEEPNLGFEFLEEVRAAYQRILEGPFRYQELRSGIRRALTRKFPYGIYFSIEGEVVVIVAVLHTARDPAKWQRRFRVLLLHSLQGTMDLLRLQMAACAPIKGTYF